MTTSGNPQPPPDDPATPDPPKKKRAGCGCLILAVLVLVVVGAVVAIGKSISSTPPDHKAEALVACQNDIRAQLQAPDSAHFDAIPDTWTTSVIDGHLTARNQLGGTIDLRYHCDVDGASATTATVTPG